VHQRRFDLVVRLEEAYRTDYAQLGQLRIDLDKAREAFHVRAGDSLYVAPEDPVRIW
jgi:HME family heavy-metal exporter